MKKWDRSKKNGFPSLLEPVPGIPARTDAPTELLKSEKCDSAALHIYTNSRIFMQARSPQWDRAFALPFNTGKVKKRR
jgi:hypothetical protein